VYIFLPSFVGMLHLFLSLRPCSGHFTGHASYKLTLQPRMHHFLSLRPRSEHFPLMVPTIPHYNPPSSYTSSYVTHNYVHFPKAFDTTWHPGLLHKLFSMIKLVSLFPTESSEFRLKMRCLHPEIYKQGYHKVPSSPLPCTIYI
jgi:hypothetical protein